MMEFADFRSVLPVVRDSFGTPRVLVVGDLMLDQYVWGDVSRISPEAPVPIVRPHRRTDMPGGAANVAANLAGLGAKVSLVGIVGDDVEAERLTELLSHAGVATDGIIKNARFPTATKTRIIGGHQQMLRVDAEDLRSADAECMDRLIAIARDQLEQDMRVVVLSDYAKGVLATETCQTIISAARGLQIPVLVGPKGPSFEKYRGALALSPNLAELALACSATVHDPAPVLRGGAELLRQLDLDYIFVTRGELGITLIERQRTRDFLTASREVYDVAGAGDTVLATLAAGLAAGLPMDDTVHLANRAAGVVVSKVGTAPILRQELLRELDAEQEAAESTKICGLDTLRDRVFGWQARGELVVFTNGCFDLLHAGHVSFLEQASRLGKRLVVGLNSDESVRRVKGPSRPIVDEGDRARIIAGLASVDAVVVFANETPIELIKTLRPDVLVKGQDRTEEEVVGAKEVKSWGGRVVLLPLLDGRSTTTMLERIENRPASGSEEG